MALVTRVPVFRKRVGGVSLSLSLSRMVQLAWIQIGAWSFFIFFYFEFFIFYFSFLTHHVLMKWMGG